jgi:asparagine synthase (glutamine-hydrolysing)
MRQQSGLTIVFDGRLDNRVELRSDLKLNSGLVVLHDADLVMHAYERWGDCCAEHLLGDFAFAIWDTSQRRIFCARDPVGGGGFTYHRDRRRFVFASLPEAMLGFPGVSPAPNELYIAHFLVPQFNNFADARSWNREIDVLLPGTSLSVFASGRVQDRRFWEIDNSPDRRYTSLNECKQQFLNVFGQAVADRLPENNPPALMMSGGLDSVAVLAMMKRILCGVNDPEVHAYSVIGDEPEGDIESRSIMALAGNKGLTLHALSVPSLEGTLSLGDLFELAWRRPHPVDNSILLPELMFLAAAREGRNALIHGACGDVALQAPRYYPVAWLKRGRFSRAWSESTKASKNNLFLRGKTPLSIFLRSLSQVLAPGSVKALRTRLKSGRVGKFIRASMISPDFARRIQLCDRMRDEVFETAGLTESARRRVQRQRSFELVVSAMSASGRLGRWHGVSNHDPFSDLRVLDFCLRVPVECRVNEGWTKFLVRSAFQDEVSSEVLWRKDKYHLGWLILRRLMQESHENARSVYRLELERIEPYVQMDGVRNLFKRFLDDGEENLWNEIFDLMTLVLWIKRCDRL